MNITNKDMFVYLQIDKLTWQVCMLFGPVAETFYEEI